MLILLLLWLFLFFFTRLVVSFRLVAFFVLFVVFVLWCLADVRMLVVFGCVEYLMVCCCLWCFELLCHYSYAFCVFGVFLYLEMCGVLVILLWFVCCCCCCFVLPCFCFTVVLFFLCLEVVLGVFLMSFMHASSRGWSSPLTCGSACDVTK